MTFEEILPQIKAGQKVIRDSWTGSELYIYEVQQPLENGEAVDPYFLIKTKETYREKDQVDLMQLRRLMR